MPANEFEKQVQEKMEDFRLNPSASVWKNVEDELREKKRKRVIFFLLIPAAAILLLIVSVYYFNHESKPDNHQVDSLPAGRQGRESIVKKHDPASNPEQGPDSHRVDSRESKVDSKNPASSIKHQASSIQHPASSTTDNINVAAIRPLAGRKKNLPVAENSNSDNSLKNKQDKVATTTGNFDVSITQPATQKKTEPKNDVVKVNSEPVATELKKATDNDQAGAASVNTDKPEAKNLAMTNEAKQAVAKNEPGKNKTRWGLDFSIGVSSIQSNPFPMLKLGGAMDAVYAPQNNPNGGSASGGGVAPPIPPSEVTGGLSFRIGYTREWQVSERSSFSGGVQYAYASTHVKIGSAVDSALRVSASYNNFTSMEVNKSYRAGDDDKYTNSFHYVAIPLGYHWQINKKIPVQLNFEVSLGYLLSSNALVYSSSNGGIYYQDDDAFNKMQFAIGTGLSYSFKTKKGADLVIGPQLSFNTNSLLANDHKQYLWFGGLNTRLFFPKKKK
ncbi:MAG TPA: porin family protein [Chitinophagaceae bacterium]|nr:porin family protein [Chitinophagaceae bacterium]